MAPRGQAYHTDWLCSFTSNVHVANHKGWFTNFTEFRGTLGSVYLGPDGGGEILGVGDVELEVTKALDQGRLFCKKIILRDVLYVPDFIANIFGQLSDTGYFTDGMKKRKIVNRETGTTVCKIDEKGVLPRLWLRRQRPGRSSLDPKGLYAINAHWSDEERARWNTYKSSSILDIEPRYSLEQKAWLKEHFRGEFRFLRTYGLKIYNEEHRDEGKRILERLMADDLERLHQEA
jgi:hypothetical protein